MKLHNTLISVVLLLCLVGTSYAALSDSQDLNPDNGNSSITSGQSANNASQLANIDANSKVVDPSNATARNGPRDWGSDGGNFEKVTSGQSAHKVSQSANIAARSKGVIAAKTLTTQASFASIPTTGNCIDNTRKVVVYMPNVTNPMRFGSTMLRGTVNVAYDPLTTAMFFEYNPDYIGDSAASLATLTPNNYEILIVPMQQMSDSAATAINTYISNGGSVWFLNDPCLTPTGDTRPNRITILGDGDSVPTSGSTTITVVNDSITRGLPTSFKPVGTTSKTTNEFRLMNGSGTISGMNYQVLMSTGNDAMLIKFENPTTGARVIYSNPNMFISGGTSSYFNAQNATQLFLQTKAWVMKLAGNPNGVGITYPKSDKQFIVTIDDVEAASWEGKRFDGTIFSVERAQGVIPSEVNTFFILPSTYTIKSEMDYYAQNGDTHSLHPHVDINTYDKYLWSWVNRSVSEYEATIKTDQSLINNRMGTTDYGFTSWRFPATSFCTNSMQAVANTGFSIDSSSGVGCMGTIIGNSQDNTLLFPKQLFINNTKTNLTEMEIPAAFDIDFKTGTEFYNKYNTVTPQFKNGNFPMNFVVATHVIGAGSKSDIATALGQIIAAEKAANPAYSNFNTLSNYINGIKSTTITASVSGSTTNVEVVNKKPITDFTIKVALGNVVSATCDGATVAVKQDPLTGSSYVTQTISAGTHKFVLVGSITSPTIPTASFSSNVSNGTAPLSVQFNDSSLNATAWNWDFGDGNTSTNQNPINTYSAAGTYTVNLTASNANGTSSTLGTINVSKPGDVNSTTASLKNLTISSGTLSPAFTSGTTNYTYNMTSVTVTPTAEDSNASITVNGIAVVSGQASQPINLNVGENKISIVVTNSGVTKTYTITVNR